MCVCKDVYIYVLGVCYNLTLYYRLTVSNVIYFILKKNLKCFYTTHIHYRIQGRI